MTTTLSSQLVTEIGHLILRNEEYTDDRWQSLALVGNFSFGQQAMNGYVYFSDGDFEARIPDFDALRKIRDLREEMKREKGLEWHQCLIHITRPDYKINFQFEYHDPERWSIKKISRDMSEYAESLKPQTEVSI